MCNSANCNHDQDDFFAGLDDDMSGADVERAGEMMLAQVRGGIAPSRKRVATNVVTHTEACKACRGTGRWVGYARSGECFKCKGKGKIEYRTSAEVRAKGAAKRAEARAEKEAAAAAWRADNQDIIAWANAKADRFDFARSMLDAINQYGSLTERQEAAVRNCMAKDEARKAEWAKQDAERKANAPTLAGIAPIVAAFAHAQDRGVKRPKMNLGAFKFSLAPATGRNAGAIYVVEASSDAYLGKIVGDRFEAMRSCTAEQQAEVVAVCSDPSAAATAYGQRTGRCSICGRELTKGESIDRAIGPICAEKYGW